MRRFAPICLLLAAAAAAGAQRPEGAARARAATPRTPDPQAPAIELRAGGATPEMRTRMRGWQRQTRDRISPVLHEWETVARAARGPWPGRSLEAGCRRLDAALAELDRRRLPIAPDPSVSLYLAETLRSLTLAAGSCAHGAFFLTDWRLQQAAASWADLRGRLVLYGLAP